MDPGRIVANHALEHFTDDLRSNASSTTLKEPAYISLVFVTEVISPDTLSYLWSFGLGILGQGP